MNKKRIIKIIEVTLVFLMIFLVVNVLWQVASRYLLKSPSSFTDELARFLMIWIGLLGAAYMTAEKEHISLDTFLKKRSHDAQEKLKFFISLAIVIFSITVMIIGGSWLVYSRHLLDVRSTALNLPMSWVYAILPISGLLIIYFEFTSNKLSKS